MLTSKTSSIENDNSGKSRLPQHLGSERLNLPPLLFESVYANHIAASSTDPFPFKETFYTDSSFLWYALRVNVTADACPVADRIHYMGDQKP